MILPLMMRYIDISAPLPPLTPPSLPCQLFCHASAATPLAPRFRHASAMPADCFTPLSPLILIAADACHAVYARHATLAAAAA
jgi:hypothetical protein